MKFNLDGLTVYFPYESIYPEQLDYMLELKKTLDARGHAVLEMPTGTGKTVSLLSLITSYQLQNPDYAGKLVYCTRTVPEMQKCIDELKVVIEYRRKMILSDALIAPGAVSSVAGVLALCLSSRKNMCIHPDFEQFEDGDADAFCRQKTAPFVRQNPDMEDSLCNYFEEFEAKQSDAGISSGIYTLKDMQELGRKLGWCPYFMARHLIEYANVIVFNYQYLLDARVAAMVSKQLSKHSIVVFDEAHNIDSVCIEALSVSFNLRSLDLAASNVNRLKTKVAEVKKHDEQRLMEEFEILRQGLIASGSVVPSELDNGLQMTLASPVHDDAASDVIKQAIPGNIRSADHFLDHMELIIKFLKSRMNVDQVIIETPLAFLHNLQERLEIDSRTLRFTFTRLNSLLKTLKIIDLHAFTPLALVADYLTLVSTPAYQSGYMIIIEPYDTRTKHFKDPILQLACLDASLAMRPVFARFRSVIITSGTLSPIDMFPKLLRFTPAVSRSLSMSIQRPCICPIIVTRGSDESKLSSEYALRDSKSVIRNFGALLIELSQVVPDGLVCFFPSYEFMEKAVAEWERSDVLKKVAKNKLIFIETKDVVETTIALDNYKRSCDCGRGAVFLSIARGKVSEGIDFDRHYGRAVLILGVPFQYTKSQSLIARLEYLRDKFAIRDNDFLAFDALRQTAQCVGRVIRSKQDYGIMIFADARYNKPSMRAKLPPWITQFLEDKNLNLGVDESVVVCREFLKSIAQPLEKNQSTNIYSTPSNIITKNQLTQSSSSAAASSSSSAATASAAAGYSDVGDVSFLAEKSKLDEDETKELIDAFIPETQEKGKKKRVREWDEA